jgi:hypothetical protein
MKKEPISKYVACTLVAGVVDRRCGCLVNDNHCECLLGQEDQSVEEEMK